MHALRRWGVYTACVAGGAAAGAWYYYYGTRRNSSSSNNTTPVKELSAREFNALQDQQLLRKALDRSHLPWSVSLPRQLPNESSSSSSVNKSASTPGTKDDFTLTLYRLLGCPYCAKVEWVLKYFGVPYEEVCIDPITAQGLPDKRYSLVPQLRLEPEDSPDKGIFLVDSAYIIDRLAAPLAYTQDLTDPRIIQTRYWISSHFQSASFVITNGTPRYAYATYGYVTPARYQNIFCRLIGSFALYALATWKIKPKMLATAQTSLNNTNTSGDKEESEKEKQAARARREHNVEAWLHDELGTFLAQRPAGATLHGGTTPDLADIEMYAVTRVLNTHPYLGHVLREGDFGAWQRCMDVILHERMAAQHV